MKARFLSLPGALQTQILRRAAACTACLALFALVIAVAYMLSGYYGLYSEQKILYSKLRPQFIDRKTK